MPFIINGWVHIPGKHCGSTALRDIMHFYGFKFSEELCFGLGAGLGFFYFEHPKASPTRYIMVRSAGMEGDFFRSIGQRFTWHTGEKDALNKVKEAISASTPVMLQTDIYYLSYYNSKTHFAGHVITAWGFDEEKGCLLVGDTGWEGLQEVPYSDLEKAWSHSRAPFFIDHNWGKVEHPGEIHLEESILRALKTQATDLLTPSFGKTSIEKMFALAEAFPSWSEAPDWKWCARFAYQVIERRGTGGGAFRKMYGQFLSEASQLMPKIITSADVEEMEEIAQMWTSLADLLKEISQQDTPVGFTDASSLMREIAIREEKFFSTLLKKLGEANHGKVEIRS